MGKLNWVFRPDKFLEEAVIAYENKHKLENRTAAIHGLFQELLEDQKELQRLENGKPKSLKEKPLHIPSQAEMDFLLKHPCAQFRRIIRQGLEVCNQKIKARAECQACAIPKIKEDKTNELQTKESMALQTEEEELEKPIQDSISTAEHENDNRDHVLIMSSVLPSPRKIECENVRGIIRIENSKEYCDQCLKEERKPSCPKVLRKKGIET